MIGLENGLELFQHQKDAITKMHNGCVLVGGVGSGKTLTALSYYKFHEHPRELVVITTAKKRDSKDWLIEAGLAGLDTDKITVSSWNGIGDLVEKRNCFFIFDEQRLVGAGTWVKAFFKIAAHNRWVLLSATPGDAWIDYAPVFIANGYFRNISEFRAKHVVYKRFTSFPMIERYVDEPILYAMQREILVKMPDIRHTKRHINLVDVDYDQELVDRVYKDRWNIYEERPLKDAGEMFRVGRQVIGSDASRFAKVVELLARHPKLIVFYNFNYELEMLRRLGEVMPCAEWNGKKHQDIPDTPSWVYLVQYTAGAEGWNCTTTDAMCLYTPNYSYKIYEQSLGRIDRMNTPYTDLHYYVLLSKTVFDKAVWRSVTQKKNFNTRAFNGMFPVNA